MLNDVKLSCSSSIDYSGYRELPTKRRSRTDQQMNESRPTATHDVMDKNNSPVAVRFAAQSIEVSDSVHHRCRTNSSPDFAENNRTNPTGVE